MINKDPAYLWRQEIFRAVKQHFNDKIEKFTHHKISEDWHFRGLAFVRDDMTYVFGFNIGFFRKNRALPVFEFDYVGANVLVRTNGKNRELRHKYQEFFEKNLQDWILQDKNIYTSFGGGLGIELPRLLMLESFGSDEEIIEFLSDCITKLSGIWTKILENPDFIFSHVVRGAPIWDETILEIALEKSKN
jgi:hypothetical protein